MPREKIKDGVLGGAGVEGRRSGNAEESKEESTETDKVQKEKPKKQKKNIFERPKFE